MNTDKDNTLIDSERRSIESSHYIKLEEKKLFPKRVIVVAYFIAFFATYLFVSWVMENPYLDFTCLYTNDAIKQCSASKFSENLLYGLIINILLASIIPFWILTMLANWAYSLGKQTESNLIKLSVSKLKDENLIDKRSANVVLNEIVSLHWSPSERVMATMNKSKDNVDE